MPEDEKKDEVYRVDTVPPPAGEDDPYNAVTKIGATPASMLAEMKKATLEGKPLKPQTLPKKPASPGAAGLPRIRDEADADVDPTKVFGSASGAIVSRPATSEQVEPAETPEPESVSAKPPPPSQDLPRAAAPTPRWHIAIAVLALGAFLATAFLIWSQTR